MSDKKEIVLSLDQSTTATGYALFIDREIKEFNIYKPSGDRNTRIEKTREWLNEMIVRIKEEYIGDIELVLEDIQMQGGNVETFKSLAQLQGVLINVGLQQLNEGNISKSKSYYASAWKSSCGIKGARRKEQKKNAQLHVLNKYGIDAPEDVCDAICLGEHHILKDNLEINFE